MENIKTRIDDARNKISDTNIKYAITDILYLKKLVERRKKTNPELSTQEIFDDINNEYREIVFNNVGKTIRNGSVQIVPNVTRSDFCLYKTISYLKKNPGKILESIDKLDKNLLITHKDYFTYTPDINSNIQELLQNTCYILIEKNGNTKLKEKFLSGTLSFEERIALEKSILNFISNYKNVLDSDMKQSYTRMITCFANILDENGCFGKGIEQHNRKLRNHGLDELQETETTKKGNKLQIRNMSDWKSSNIVSNLSLDELIMASAFFTNKATKEFILFKKSIFLLNELGISDISTYKQYINEEQLKNALIKYEFLQTEARNDFSRLSSTLSPVIEPDNERNTRTITFELEYTPEDVEEYKKEFDLLLPNSENDIFNDRTNFNLYDETMENLYKKKDFAIDSLILSFIDNGKQYNWGYIPENNGYTNSIQRGDRMIGLGFDFTGYNMPIKLHKSVKDLKKLLEQYNGKTTFPVYQGNEDWTITDNLGYRTNMTVGVFRPTTKFERKTIREKLKTLSKEDYTYNFCAHLNWLSNGVTPEKYSKKLEVSLEDGNIYEENIKLHE